MTIRNLLNLTVSLGMSAIALKAAYFAYLGFAVGMVKEAVIGLIAASLALGFALLMMHFITLAFSKKKK